MLLRGRRLVAIATTLLGLATVGLAVCDNPGFPVDCHDGRCCPDGNTCNAFNSRICCPGEFPVQCRSICCPAGTQCSPDGTRCLNPDPCSNPDFPVNCQGVLCCPGGDTCNTLNTQLCCPPGYPVSCTQVCCPPDHLCSLDGTSCIRDLSNGAVAIVAALSGSVRVNDLPSRVGENLDFGDTIDVAPNDSVTIRFLADPGGGGTITARGGARGARLKMPSELPSAATKVFRLIRGWLDINKDKAVRTRWEVEGLNCTSAIEGTILSIQADPDAARDTVLVTEGQVTVRPKNPALSPFTVSAGQRVEMGGDTVGAVTLLCLVGQCDDRDACTVDTCTTAACHQQPVTGFDAVCSACRGGLGSRACADQPIPGGLGKRFVLACTLREQAGTRTPTAAQKLLRRATKRLKAAGALAQKATKKHKHPISAECATVIDRALRGTF